ncbi:MULTISPECIES: hypothetical protein, partial [unclassified Anaerobiospirillum]|uniref:beta strand repeat-containing protein n=1 Tax=unclassified Anaerobiospirillum TaxID=2647410 RepID=UPI001FF3F92B
MKLSNNAIKFLMAQYRAIYKNAYVKGLATAVILTSALAAGQAQAAAQPLKQDSQIEADVTQIEIVADGSSSGSAGKYNALTVSGDANFGDYDLLISSGNSTANKFSGGKAATTFTVKNLTINAKAAAQGLSITGGASNKAHTLTAKENITVDAGSIVMSGDAAGNAIIQAPTITVGKSDATIAAKIQTDSNTVVGYALDGNGIDGAKTKNLANYSTINLNKSGSIGTKPDIGANSLTGIVINAATLNIDGGEILTGHSGSAADAKGVKATINIVNGKMDSGTIKTTSTKASDQKLTLNFAAGDWKSGETAVEKVFTINGGTLDLATDMVVTGKGTLKFAKDLKDVTLGAGGKGIKVSGDASVYADDLTHAKAIAGKLPLTLAGTLEVGGTDAMVIGGTDGLTFAGTSAVGTVGLDAGAKIKSEKFVVNDDLAAAGTLIGQTVTVNKNKLEKTSIQASSALNLGMDTNIKSVTLAAGDLAAINKKHANDKGTEDLKAELLSQAGTISTAQGVANGKLTLDQDGAALNIDNGTWNSNIDMVLGSDSSGATVQVGKADNTNSTAAALIFNQGSKLTLTSGTVTVGASTPNKLLSATLDLSKIASGDLTISNSKDSTITVNKRGTLVLSNDQVKLITGTGNKLKTSIAESGTLSLSGDVELLASNIGTSPDYKKIAFTGAGKLEADNLTINDVTTALDVNGSTISATSLTLNNIDNSGTAQPVKLGSGNYIVTEELLTEKNGTVLELGQNASLQLGDIGKDADGNNYSVTTAGNTNMSLKLNDGTAKVDFVTGKWGNNKTSLEVANGQVSIGSEILDANYNVISAQVTGSKLTQASGAITLNSGSTATFTEINQTNGTLNIEGAFVIEGKHTPYEAAVTGSADSANDKAAVPQSYGVSLKAATVSGANASLTFGAEAMGAVASIDSSVDGKTVKVNYKTTDNTSSGSALDLVTDKITLEDFGTLKLGFGSGDKFTLDQLKAIRKEFLGKDEAIDTGFISLGNATIDGVTPSGGTLAFTELNKFKDFTDFVVGDLKDATITGVDGTVNGNVGRLETAEGSVTVGVATLNNCKGGAFAYDKATGDAVKITVNKSGMLGLNNGGKAGEVILSNGDSRGTTLLISGGSANVTTDVAKISAKGLNTEVQVASGILNVKGGVTAGSVKTSADTTLNIEGSKSATGLTLSNAEALSEFKGSVNAQNVQVNFAGETVFAGNNNNFLLMNASGKDSDLTFKNGTTTVSSMLGIDVSKAVDNGVEVLDNAVLNVDGAIKLGAESYLGVGSEHEYAADGKTVVESGSTGYLYAKMVDLNGGIMAVDPEYGMKTSVAAVGAFGAGTFNLLNANDAGTVSGDVVVSQNAALGVGQSVNLDTVKNFVAQYQDADGSLSKDGVANVLYIDGKIASAKGSRIILDGQNRLDDSVAVLRDASSKFAYGYDADANDKVDATEMADLYIGNGSILALGNGAINGAIEFAGEKAAIYAPASADAKKAQQGKIVLAGEDFLKSRNITLFTAGAKAGTVGQPDTAVPGSAKNVTVLGETGKDDIRVESLNGLMYFTLEAGKALEEKGYNLKLDTKRVDTAFTAASEPMRDFLIGYTAQDKNWYDVANAVDGAKTEVLLGATASPMISAEGGNIAYSADATEEFKQANPLSNFVAVNTGTAEAPQYVAYEKAYNGFLEDVVR